MVWVDFANVEDFVHNHFARFQLVLTFHLSLSHIASAGYVLVKVVCMSRADIRDVLSGLGKGSSVGGMRMDDALNVWKRLI